VWNVKWCGWNQNHFIWLSVIKDFFYRKKRFVSKNHAHIFNYELHMTKNELGVKFTC